MSGSVVSFTDKYLPKSAKKESMTVIGSGMAGLMTAWEAEKAGYDVTVISQSPDPRNDQHDNDNPSFSSTFDSKNDQRYITLFEGHPYLELVDYVDKMYPNIADDFTKHVLEGGLLAVPFTEFKAETQDWLAKRMEVNKKLKMGDQEAIFQVTELFEAYEQENRAAMEKWYDLLQDVIKQSPELIETLSLSYDGIIRLYDNAEVFNQSKESHIRGGVFKEKMTPEELAKKYPAYNEGVKNGFIAGGAIEMHGLTLGVKALGKEMVRLLNNKGVKFQFNKPVEKIVVKNDVVQGIKLESEENLYTSKHIIAHPGAFSKPSLFEDVPEAQAKLAAVEGYWITIEDADEIVAQMGGKPNKVHGKQTIAALLDKLPQESANRYTEILENLDIKKESFEEIAPIVDFNNMPLKNEKGVSLGVGSGYIFKGLAYAGDNGKPEFSNDKKSEKFVLAVMELWLEVLHGRELLETGNLVAHHIGCKRSWTIDDKEVDVNYLTKDGGLMGIRGGGNTGDTTKSTLVADYNVKLMQEVDSTSVVPDNNQLAQTAQEIRIGLRKTIEDMPQNIWEEKTKALEDTVKNAAISNLIGSLSGRNESDRGKIQRY